MSKHRSRNPKPPKCFAAVPIKVIRPSGVHPETGALIFHPDTYREMQRRGWISATGEWQVKTNYSMHGGIQAIEG